MRIHFDEILAENTTFICFIAVSGEWLLSLPSRLKHIVDQLCRNFEISYFRNYTKSHKMDSTMQYFEYRRLIYETIKMYK